MILFYNQDVTYKVCNRRAIKHWLNDVIVSEKHHPGDINIIFCSSDFLRNMNVRFLQHDYCTDVITFPYDDERHRVSGDVLLIYIQLMIMPFITRCLSKTNYYE